MKRLILVLFAFGLLLRAQVVPAVIGVNGDGSVIFPGNVKIGGAATIGTTVLPSGLTSPFSIVKYGAVGDVRSITDAAITAGQTALTSASAAFTSADTGKSVVVAMGTKRLTAATYTSGLTVTGTKGQTCTFSAFDGGGSAATAAIYLSDVNTVAASTPLLITAQGTGYTSAPTTATVASGTATCSGTPVLSASITPAPIQATAAYVSATQINLSVAATSTISSARMTIGTDDTPAIQAAINAAQAAHSSLIIPSGTWNIASGPLVISDAMKIEGVGVYPIYGQSSTIPQIAPYLRGSVLLVTKPDTDAIQITIQGSAVHMSHLAIRFDPSFAFINTGHGILTMPPLAATGGLYDLGIFGAQWSDLAVWGHDGNHYAFKLVNQQYMTVSGLQSWGGGGMELYAWANWGYPGNNVFIHPYLYTFAGGTANGYWIHTTTGVGNSRENLNVFIRPQSITDYMQAAFSTWGIPTVNKGQRVMLADATATYMTLESPDFETNAGSSSLINGLEPPYGYADNLYQAGGTEGTLITRFFRASSGAMNLYDYNGVTIANIGSSGVTTTAASNTVNYLTSNLGGNPNLRLGDYATSGTRKEFTILLDMTNHSADLNAIAQGSAAWMMRLNTSGGIVSVGGASTVLASATTIAPTKNTHHISGTAEIDTITVPTGYLGGCLHFVPDGAFTFGTSGNISLASTAVVNRVMEVCWDGTKWNPSY